MADSSGFRMKLSEIARVLGSELTVADATVCGVSTDTRTVKPGELFVALKGENFDGHQFASQAMEKGAVACLMSEPVESVPAIMVDDTRIALGQLAAAWRSRFSIPVIAVTGSNGKTTVKEMLASILGVHAQVLSTTGNLNNDIGVPLTLFRLDESHQAAVIEMGANHHGEIAYLVNIAKPGVAVITNAGEAHLEGFGSIEGVAKAKGEIYSRLGATGFAIINQDDQFSGLWKALAQNSQQITFGLSGGAAVTADWNMTANGSELVARTGKDSVSISLSLLGRHNVMNALAAIATCTAIGIELGQIKSGLEKLQPVKGRLQLKPGKNSSRIIDDTYNANPSSLRVALDVLAGFPGRHLLALGDMGELGSNSVQLHQQAGHDAAVSGIDHLYAVGELAAYAAKETGKHGSAFIDRESLVAAIESELGQDVTVLVKGSRRMQMEKVVDSLTVTSKG